MRFGDLTEEISRFICSGCSKDFWIKSAEVHALTEADTGIIGLKSEEHGAFRAEPCPKCKTPVLNMKDPCPQCGVVPFKFMSLQGESPYLKVGDEIQELWRRVLNHYDDLGVHHEFLSECMKKNHLRFASLKYKQLKEIVGADPLIINMLKKVENLTSLELQKRTPVREDVVSTRFRRIDQIMIVAGIVCIVMGVTSPLMRNWVGVGAVLVSFPFVFRYFLSKS